MRSTGSLLPSVGYSRTSTRYEGNCNKYGMSNRHTCKDKELTTMVMGEMRLQR